MPVINQLNTSTLSLQGNRINAVPTQPAWGYIDASANLDPAASKLQNTYSVNSIPPVRLKDFNINGVTTVPAESRLDELDRRAPNLTAGGIVSQVYKSPRGRQYKDLGPRDGRY
jgi:hypothetical protein